MQPLLGFVIFLLLFIVLLGCFVFAGPYGNGFYVIPGLNVTYYPNPYFWTCIEIILLIIVIMCYWKLHHRKMRISGVIFILHLCTTLPAIINNLYPLTPAIIDYSTEEDFINSLSASNRLIQFFTTLFIAGHLLFIIYYFKTLKSTPS